MEVLNKTDKNKVVAIDIETVRLKKEYDDLSEDTKKAWRYKTKYEGKELPIKELRTEWINRASLYAEFSKVCAVSLVFLNKEKITAKEFYGETEQNILYDLNSFLGRIYNNDFILVGHAARYFDYPYLAKRYIVNNISIPKILDTSNKKPWEHSNLCTNELWKSFGTGPGSSLVALCNALNIPGSKDDMTGDEVGEAFFKGQYKRISDYCTKDSLSTFNVFLRLKGEQGFYETENIQKVGEDEQLTLVEHIRANKKIDKKAELKIKEFLKDRTIEEKDNLKTILLSAVGKTKTERAKIEKL